MFALALVSAINLFAAASEILLASSPAETHGPLLAANDAVWLT